MAMKPIVRSPDLDSARRGPNTGEYLDKPTRGMVKRMPKGRMNTMIRRATGTRKLT